MAMCAQRLMWDLAIPDAAWPRDWERTKRNDVRGVASFSRTLCARDKSQSPIRGLVALEPAPPAPIAAATKNQQYDENDQKGCRVHVALLRLANAREDHFTLSLGRKRRSG